MPGPFNDRPAALVIAHPGHELRVYHWVSSARPYVFVLTDGSGHRKSRLDRTTRMVSSLGARQGSIYGRLSDAEIYAAILARDTGLFVGLAGELAEALVRDRIEYLAGDAIEGYNPAHDVCRLVIDAAVRKACRMNHSVENYEIVVAGRMADEGLAARPGVISIVAGEQQNAEKLRAARDYSELEADVNRILAHEGIASLKSEYLSPVNSDSNGRWLEQPPYYEAYGEKQVAAGRYEEVIRYRDHVLMIGDALAEI
jgi:hypothetical protein